MVLEGVRKKLADKISPKTAVQEAWNRMHKEAGFIPIFNKTDLEGRREEIKGIMADIETKIFDPDQDGVAVKTEVVQKTFKMFWSEGDAWYRGLDNRELSEKVACFLANCTDCGYMTEFMPDLFEEAMVLLHFSFQALDVTNTPPYIIESKPVVFAGKGAGGMGPETETDAMGQLEMRNRIRELEEQLEAKGEE